VNHRKPKIQNIIQLLVSLSESKKEQNRSENLHAIIPRQDIPA
jgi:hypothetical protein